MYKRILVAVDGSHTSEQALQEAVRLAREGDGSLHLVHVVDEVILESYSEYGSWEELREPMRSAGRAILEKSETLAKAGGVKVDTKLLINDTLRERAADLIAQEAEAWGADLIVVGTHGRRGVNRLLVGSVAERIVRAATKPVLLIRAQH